MTKPDLPAPKKARKQEALWLMSFSDMSLVLMTFFVLLLSMSTVNKKRFEHVKDHMESQVKDATRENLEHLFKLITREIKRRKIVDKVEATYDADGIHVEFKDGSLFASGSAKTNPEMQKVVDSVLAIIGRAPEKYKLTIEGHTDDTPLRGQRRYRSNWELSAARGFELMRKFTQRGVDEKRISVVAYAHTRPKVPIDNLKGNQLKSARSANRRVIINID